MAGGGTEEGEFGLQIAPMLDVMFVLLLFFMVSAGQVAKERELGVKVPGDGKPVMAPTASTPVTLTISKDGEVRYNDALMGSPNDHDLTELRETMKQLITVSGEQPVIIKPDATTSHQRLIDVLNACSYAGVKNLTFGG